MIKRVSRPGIESGVVRLLVIEDRNVPLLNNYDISLNYRHFLDVKLQHSLHKPVAVSQKMTTLIADAFGLTSDSVA